MPWPPRIWWYQFTTLHWAPGLLVECWWYHCACGTLLEIKHLSWNMLPWVISVWIFLDVFDKDLLPLLQALRGSISSHDGLWRCLRHHPLLCYGRYHAKQVTCLRVPPDYGWPDDQVNFWISAENCKKGLPRKAGGHACQEDTLEMSTWVKWAILQRERERVQGSSWLVTMPPTYFPFWTVPKALPFWFSMRGAAHDIDSWHCLSSHSSQTLKLFQCFSHCSPFRQQKDSW